MPLGGSARAAEKPPQVRNATLHQALEAFTVDASGRLAAEIAAGAELPFELVVERGGTAALYCYQPLTADFVRDRFAVLRGLATYEPAAAAIAECEALDAYLQEQGLARVPGDRPGLIQATVATFLGSVFADRSEFGFEPVHFEASYSGLEHALYEGHCMATVIAPLLGVALDRGTTDLALGDGLSLIRGDALRDAPSEAVWGDSEEPNVLAVLAVGHERSARPPVSVARVRFKRILTALRLFERGGYAIGPVAWTRTEAGSWRPVALGANGRPRLLTLVPADQEDELRAFCDLVARKLPGNGELAWALARFEMGCERLAPFEALTDYLLALRALLEPEGPSSGRLAQRLSVICAPQAGRAALAERTARAISLERAVMTGLAPSGPGADSLVDELAENLRAILRDALCGHLDADLCSVADRLLAEGATAEPAFESQSPVV
ncbi:MAG: hypothetical protein ACTHQQ_09770 [Solirubrobacteraceae bacterium]